MLILLVTAQRGPESLNNHHSSVENWLLYEGVLPATMPMDNPAEKWALLERCVIPSTCR